MNDAASKVVLGANRLETLAYLQSKPYRPDADRVLALGAHETARRHREYLEESADWYCRTYPQLVAQGFRHGSGHEPGAHVAWVDIDGAKVDLWVVSL